MPPKRKFNKQKLGAQPATLSSHIKTRGRLVARSQKKQITSRLMAISLLVDKYIYKNKQITIGQAQMYLEELTSLKSQCMGDAPSLQVCEKLTRCMKGIIEEQSNDAVLQDKEVSLDLSQPSHLYVASPVYSLPDEDKTQMGSETDFQPENDQTNYKVFHTASIISEENKDKNKDKKSVRFSMDIDHIDTECNNESITVVESYNVINTDSNNENPHTLETYQHCTVNNELTDRIVDLNLEDVEPPINNGDLCSQSLLKNMDVVETPETIEDCFINNTCGQDMDEFDREVNELIDPVSQGCISTKKDSVHKTVSVPMVYNIPPPMNKATNTFQTVEKHTILNNNPLTNQIIKNKPNKDMKQKKTITKKKNKENEPEKKRKIKSKLTGKDNSRLAFTPLTNYSEKTQLPLIKTDKNSKTNNEFNMTKKAVNNIEIQSKNISNIVETPETNQLVEINIIPNNSTVYGENRQTTVRFEEDLSWVENLRYVREIHLEYDSGSKLFSDSFWDNCELPNNWDSRDFELL